MKSELPASQGFPEKNDKDKFVTPPSRFMDEKMCDDSDTESTADKAMAPAGLKNPFWN